MNKKQNQAIDLTNDETMTVQQRERLHKLMAQADVETDEG